MGRLHVNQIYPFILLLPAFTALRLPSSSSPGLSSTSLPAIAILRRRRGQAHHHGILQLQALPELPWRAVLVPSQRPLHLPHGSPINWPVHL